MLFNSVFDLFSLMSIANTVLNNNSNTTWKLVFNDEFSGTSLNESVWEYQTGCSESKNIYIIYSNRRIFKTDSLLILTFV